LPVLHNDPAFKLPGDVAQYREAQASK
jgi:hypothetical protein